MWRGGESEGLHCAKSVMSEIIGPDDSELSGEKQLFPGKFTEVCCNEKQGEGQRGCGQLSQAEHYRDHLRVCIPLLKLPRPLCLMLRSKGKSVDDLCFVEVSASPFTCLLQVQKTVI